ncbi:zeaxanthin epoxidase [Micractinium conductrix]|uniref:Zeaxanthin epoxidase, chloroplastic n=1 Tax=Micractinium conductrix TaxID=554055 RepID=A0A2P6VCE3_9CHLO|nr:zeaxanthin epoxidase [Micractinium conductrix]|eukprot:PSC71770.1 zeaxanthin epoxidase [Micractinium conductrix]
MKSTHSSRRAPAQQQQVLGARRAVGGSCAAALAAWSAATAPVPARRDPCTTQAVAAPEAPPPAAAAADSRSPPLKVVIAGAGIGGLVLAVGLLKRGFDVTVLERDMTAIRGEGKYRGPIQIQSNALGALEALDARVAERVYEEGCITGDRVNGLCDGVTGDWYVKFDTFHPAADMGLPVTRVISRILLQEILADTCRELAGDDVVTNSVQIVDYEQTVDGATGKKIVTAIASDGRRFSGDLLIGADGIWSKVRERMIGPTDANYSQYTCYTGISDFTPPDIDIVGYRVFLGNGRYFVSSDVGGGKMQWYGFHKEPAGGTDPEGMRKQRLLNIFGDWTHQVTDLIKATPEREILRRDIFDRAPIFKWADGRVALLGDSAHAMQPNLGQGGCMAIEDAYQLVLDLCKEADKVESGKAAAVDVEGVLSGYTMKRVVRAASIHGMAGMAAYMASTYKAYLGEGLGPLEWLTKFKIPHPGRVVGQVIMKATMPGTMGRILGGFRGALAETDRHPTCSLSDQPQGFPHDLFALYMENDDALLRASHAAWMLVPAASASAEAELHQEFAGIKSRSPPISRQGLAVGRAAGSDMVLEAPSTSQHHARLHQCELGDYHVTDLGSEHGTWVNGQRLEANVARRMLPADDVIFGSPDLGGQHFVVRMIHNSLLAENGRHGGYDRTRSTAPHAKRAAGTAAAAQAPAVVRPSQAGGLEVQEIGGHTVAAQGLGRTPPAELTRMPSAEHAPTRARGVNKTVPAPPGLTRRGGQESAERQQASGAAKRAKELRDRASYLKNMWYAAAISDKVGTEPVKTRLCGRDMVLFRDDAGKVHCIDNTCPHRGAPLSKGWVQHNVGGSGHSCVVCPYHGWALDGHAQLRDVPASENKGEWPKRALADSWPVEEKGGFVWVFYGSRSLPADARPPIPYCDELDDPSWKAVYAEIEFDAGHFGVFENAIDMAHIHYLHGDSFGNQGKPEIKGMQATTDAHCVTATFTIHNKASNPFWELFQVPEVHVTAKAFLPSTSLVTFTLGGGLSFTTFVNTIPISATRSINRFALVRKLGSDPTGIFNWKLWDGMARNAMMKIQMEDKEMVEQLRYDLLQVEYNVRADLPQVMFRKLRQQYVDMGYVVPTEKDVAPFVNSPAREAPMRRAVAAQQQQQGLSRSASAELDAHHPFLEPLMRSFILGAGTGALLEAGHFAMQVLTGGFPGLSAFTPAFAIDHAAAIVVFLGLYALDASAVTRVLKRFNWDAAAAAPDLGRLSTLPKKMLPGRLSLLKRLVAARTRLAKPAAAAVASAATAADDTTSSAAEPAAAEAAPAAAITALPPSLTGTVAQAPTRARGANNAVPAPPGLTRRGGQETAEQQQASGAAKRAKELRDRESYLKNMWYAAAISDKVGTDPVETQLCGRDMVLFRDDAGKVHCIDNTCPHRGAPLSEGWVQHNVGGSGHSCVVCPYHGWALDGHAQLRDVPASENKGEWPKRALADSWPVEEKGGFVWVFYGSRSLPADARPPIPYCDELDDPSWKAVYAEIEFDAGHFGVFENAIDMAHIHYLHGDSFGNQGKPEIKGMQATTDAHCVTATFTIHNKASNPFWELFQVPEVHVTAKAFLPSTSLVTFTLGGGLSFTTFVNTIPISATRSINRFALVRKLGSDPTGIFNWKLWDGMARNAMMKIQMEDKEMVEQLRYDQLQAEYNVRADLPQVMFRKLRQQYVDMGYAVPTEKDVAPFVNSPAREVPMRRA